MPTLSKAQRVRAVEDLDVQRYRTADAVAITGMNLSQVHHLAKGKLQLDWGSGYGKPRLLSLAELFTFRLVSQLEKSVPPKALRDLASCGRDYIRATTYSAELRAKNACILGYQDKRGSWWWLLCHSGMLPDDPPEIASDLLLVLRVKHALAAVLKLADEVRSASPDEAPAPFAEPVMAGGPGDDLQLAAMAFSRHPSAGGIAL